MAEFERLRDVEREFNREHDRLLAQLADLPAASL
jgi:hypothetical protein